MANETRGCRVFAVESADKSTVRLFGVGVYVGDEIPPPEIEAMRFYPGLPNPKIVLDNGSVVWGCECWWGPEARLPEFTKDRTVETVPVPTRKAA